MIFRSELPSIFPAPAFSAVVLSVVSIGTVFVGDLDRLAGSGALIEQVGLGQPLTSKVEALDEPQVSHTQSLPFIIRSGEVGAKCEVLIRQGAGHGGWKEMTEVTARMGEWFDQQLLGKQPERPFTFGISSLPSTPVKR